MLNPYSCNNLATFCALATDNFWLYASEPVESVCPTKSTVPPFAKLLITEDIVPKSFASAALGVLPSTLNPLITHFFSVAVQLNGNTTVFVLVGGVTTVSPGTLTILSTYTIFSTVVTLAVLSFTKFPNLNPNLYPNDS